MPSYSGPARWDRTSRVPRSSMRRPVRAAAVLLPLLLSTRRLRVEFLPPGSARVKGTNIKAGCISMGRFEAIESVVKTLNLDPAVACRASDALLHGFRVQPGDQPHRRKTRFRLRALVREKHRYRLGTWAARPVSGASTERTRAPSTFSQCSTCAIQP